jgi:hypothetical protein
MGEEGLVDSVAERFHIDRYTVYLGLLLFLYTIFHLVMNYFMGLQVDEANWLMQTKNLQAGYFFHPPFVVYELYVISNIFGESTLALRMGSLLFTLGSLILIYNLSLEMFKDHKWAWIITAIITLLPITNYWLTLAHQDPPFFFFNLLTALFIWRAIDRDQKSYWYLAGISAGFMLLCKLQAVIIFPSLLLFLLISKKNRHWLRKKEPYLGFGIVVLMFLPTFLWYVSHQFEPITYQLSSRPGLFNNNPLDYISFVLTHIGKEMVVLSPFVYLLSIFGIFYGCYLGYFRKEENDNRFQLLFWLSAPAIILFTLTGGPPYWSISGHFLSLIALSGALPLLLSHTSRQSIKRWWRPAFVILFILPSLVFTMGTMLIAGGDHIQNDWKPLAEKVAEVREGIGGEDVYMAGPYYFIPSEIAYFEPDTFEGYTLAFQVYEHEVIGASNSEYSPWVPLDDLVGKDFIFVDAEMNPDDFDTPVSFWVEKLQPYFEHVDEPVIFEYKKWSNDIRRYYIFKAYGFKGYSPEMDIKGEIRDYLDSLSNATASSFEG